MVTVQKLHTQSVKHLGVDDALSGVAVADMTLLCGQGVRLAVSLCEAGDFGTPVPDYTDENVSGKVVRLIQSYTRIVDRNVWRKKG